MTTERPSYPPATHVLRDLGMVIDRQTRERTVVTVPNFRDLAVLSIVIDVAGAGIALSAIEPDWIATVDMSVQSVAAPDADHLSVVVTPVRIGSRLVVVRADVHDGDETAPKAAVGFLTFTRIPGTATAAEKPDFSPGRSEMEPSAAGPPARLLDRLGYERLEHDRDQSGGRLSMTVHDYVRNSFGAPNGGVMAHFLASGARQWAGDGVDVSDIHVRYLAQANTGPIVTALDVLRNNQHGATVIVEARDTANHDHRLAVTTIGREPR